MTVAIHALVVENIAVCVSVCLICFCARVRHMLSTGALKQPPLWMEVVEAFPPLHETKHNTLPEPGTPPLITYPEDENRR